ncbi:MAG: pbpE 6 [Acidobacteria bacterium]|nr:pbpE 6 [Acidobacteriota bacterium]
MILFVLALSVASVFHPAKLQEMDAAIGQAISERKLPGGVLWIERNGAVYTKAYGNRAVEPRIEPMTRDTIFDAASLTKVTVTAPAIFLLIERGRVSLDARVATYLPEFRGGWRDEVTVRHLLTHTSGLRPDVDLDEPWSGAATGIRLALAEEPRNRPGFVFRYSDINFLLLGEIVQRVSGQPLERFAARELFAPLGMHDSGFKPALTKRIAPTEHLRGAVHDPTARRMGGVAGHAGLFTTAADLARYARCIVNGGAPVFRRDTVTLMTRVLSPPNVAQRRGGGWDVDSGYSRPRGALFPIGSFGHTGFTGGMLWIDPFSKTFWLFLSNRVHPDGRGNVVALQYRLGTLAAQAVRDFDFAQVPGALPPRRGGVISPLTGAGNALNGIDALHADGYKALQGLRIGLITNASAIDRAGNPTADLLRSAPGVNLVALFSPEHGIRGEADAKVGDSIDDATGLPVLSLYGERRKPSPEQLASLDALVFDIQDVGTRYYTYIATMGLAMEAAATAHKKFFVLDRVNPIGGSAFEGPLSETESFTSYHPLPVRHGMTAGELARMFRDERHLDLDLEVIAIRNWTRGQWQDDAGLHWINPSPNMRSLNAAALYPGIGLLESAVSVGRGTATPFELLGAPYIDGDALARALTDLHLPGIRFEPVRFTPEASIFKGQPCGGVRFRIIQREAFRPVRTGMAIALTLRRLYGERFDLAAMKPLLRHQPTLDALRDGKPLAEIVAMWNEEAFGIRRAPYLLYR